MHRKLMIATPAMNGQVTLDYALSLSSCLHHLAALNIQVSLYLRHSGSLLIAERNNIINAFLKSDCTHLLCIDADIGWKPDAVTRLLDSDRDIVGCAYPSREKKEYLLRFVGEKVIAPDEDGLVKVLCLPAGFIMISKDAAIKIAEDNQDLFFRSIDGKEEGFCLYNPMVWNKEFWGEDFSFCIRAHLADLSVYLDANTIISHGGYYGEPIGKLLVERAKNG